MKFTIVTDVHIGPEGTGYAWDNIQRKLTTKALGLLDQFAQEMRDTEKPEFIVQLGDLVEDGGAGVDPANYQAGVDSLKQSGVPVYHVVGNHDLVHNSEEELCEMTGHDQLYYSFDQGEFHFITLMNRFPEKMPPTDEIRRRAAAGDLSFLEASIDDAQLEWLRQDLSQTDKPTIVFVHFSLADQDLSGNFWFQGRPTLCLIKNRAEVRQILADSGKVKAVFNGHIHWNHIMHHDGIPYINLQALSENFQNDGTAANTYAVVETLNSGEIRVDIRGLAPTIQTL